MGKIKRKETKNMEQQLALSAISTLAYSIQMQAQGESWKYNDPWQRLGVTMDGEDLDLFIVRTHWSDITPLGETGYNMGFNGRAYLSTSQDWNKDNYFRPNLLGGSMEYDVDLSQVAADAMQHSTLSECRVLDLMASHLSPLMVCTTVMRPRLVEINVQSSTLWKLIFGLGELRAMLATRIPMASSTTVTGTAHALLISSLMTILRLPTVQELNSISILSKSSTSRSTSTPMQMVISRIMSSNSPREIVLCLSLQTAHLISLK